MAGNNDQKKDWITRHLETWTQRIVALTALLAAIASLWALVIGFDRSEKSETITEAGSTPVGVFVLEEGDYDRFLRFYGDGLVLSVIYKGSQNELLSRLERTSSDTRIGRGWLSQKGSTLQFTTTTDHGKVHYEGDYDGNNLYLKLRSEITGNSLSGIYRRIEN